jgi:hypothetical protein
MYSVMLRPNPLPRDFRQLLETFRTSQWVHLVIKLNLIAGANFALGWMRKWHPRLNYDSMSQELPPGCATLGVDDAAAGEEDYFKAAAGGREVFPRASLLEPIQCGRLRSASSVAYCCVYALYVKRESFRFLGFLARKFLEVSLA